MKRRGFLKAAGALACALFIPAERLDFGTPKQALAVPDERTWDYFRERLTGEIAPGPGAGPLTLDHLKARPLLVDLGPDEQLIARQIKNAYVAGTVTGVSPTLSIKFQESGNIGRNPYIGYHLLPSGDIQATLVTTDGEQATRFQPVGSPLRGVVTAIERDKGAGFAVMKINGEWHDIELS